MKNETKAALKELRRLRDSVGSSLYERSRLASVCLADTDWLAEEFEGDEFRAADYVQEKFFSELGGSIGVLELVSIYRQFPDVAAWKEREYNIKTLLAEVQTARPEREKRTVTRVTRKEYEDLKDAKEHAEFVAKRYEQEAKDKIGVVERLQERVRELENENHTLHGRISELERLLDRIKPHAA